MITRYIKGLLALMLALAGLYCGYICPEADDVQVPAKSAVVMDADSGRILFEQNSEESLPMASTTKIMTALITLEQPDLDEKFVVDSEALRVEGSSMGLRDGDWATLHALAIGMLLSSGNDAANAAAVRISGNIADFVELMNRRAEELGLHGTHFANPSGLDADKHYSTAHDLALLAGEALKNSEFSAICSQMWSEAEFGAPPYTRKLKNHNRLLAMYEGAIGVKTGFTKKAGRCLVSAVQRENMTLICVTLNCPDDWNVHMQLYDRCFAAFTAYRLNALLPEVRIPVTGSVMENVRITASSELCAALTEREYSDVTVKVCAEKFMFAPIKKGDTAGYAVFLLDGEEVGRVPLVADENVPVKSAGKDGWHTAFKKIFDRLLRD